MPKNKKPAGGRPAKNFDPRYAKKKPHRGQGGAAGKNRWSDEDRAKRDDARSFSRDTGGSKRPAHGPVDRFGDDRRRGRDDRRPHGGRDGRSGDYDGEARRRAAERADRGHAPGDHDEPRGGAERAGRADRGYGRGRDERRIDRGHDSRRHGRSGSEAHARDDRRAGADRDERRFAGGREDRRIGRGPSDGRGRGDRRPGTGRDAGSERDVRRASGSHGSRGARAAQADGTGFGGRRESAGERAWRENRDARQKPQRSKAQDDRIDVVHGRLEAQAVEAVDVEGLTFADLGLGDNIVRTLADLGATAPFPIQASTADAILGGRDVLARGRTGSGKTIAFGAPLVERMLRAQKGAKREYGRAPIALILAPTRELALQIDRTVQPIARSVGLFTTQIYGGVPQNRQVGALKRGVDIVIGTPGRIEDLHRQGKLDLSNIRASVLDEADHMCELGFLEPVQRILRLTAQGGQKLLFSATLDREVAALVDEFLTDPAVYEVAGETQETGTIDHRVLVVEHRRKPEVLEQLVIRDGKTLVFTRTRAFAEQLSDRFCEAGVKALALHGDLTQARRSRNIEKFAKGTANVLVATDVAARGIHVDDVDLVVQADAPDEYKTYLHRSGRTGRAGNEGRVVTLIPRGRKRRMEELLDRAEIDAPFEEAAPGDDLLDELAGAPTVAELTTR